MRRITTSDEDLLLEISPCDEDQVDIFTAGDCWKLARELHSRGVGRLVAVSEEDNPDFWCHMAVELPDGLYLDARGIQSKEQILERWGGFIYRGEATLAYHDPADEEHWVSLTEEQEGYLSDQDDVDSTAEILIQWLEDL